MKILEFYEYSLFFLYIYALIFLFIFIKPTFYTKTFLFVYMFSSSFFMIHMCKFMRDYPVQRKVWIALFSIVYALGFVIVYETIYFYFLNSTYLHNDVLLHIIPITPVIYIVYVKLSEYLFDCGQHHMSFFWAFKSFIDNELSSDLFDVADMLGLHIERNVK